MNNFFSGNQMANDIMRQTSLPQIMRDYQNDHNAGVVRNEEYHPDRLNVAYETTKPFLDIPLPPEVRPPNDRMVDIGQQMLNLKNLTGQYNYKQKDNRILTPEEMKEGSLEVVRKMFDS